MVDIFRSNNPKAWEQFCNKYHINNEGRADDDTTCEITEGEKETWIKT